jgi:hypothetical protein
MKPLLQLLQLQQHLAPPSGASDSRGRTANTAGTQRLSPDTPETVQAVRIVAVHFLLIAQQAQSRTTMIRRRLIIAAAAATALAACASGISNAPAPAPQPATTGTGAAGKTEVLWLGQAATRITTPGGKVIVVDPWLTGNPKTPPRSSNCPRWARST